MASHNHADDKFPELTSEHTKIYSGFLGLVKFSAGLTIVALILLAIFVV
ncbi:MAG: aa3-type cytochrome c oxidase subunit IV [Alphaproteobacteria bacterium]|nr:aa3-type cytochrome c oxidase subunit IV [Alphaproteobacteria bacterium]